jgi:hypothetical protein
MADVVDAISVVVFANFEYRGSFECCMVESRNIGVAVWEGAGRVEGGEWCDGGVNVGFGCREEEEDEVEGVGV